jgi:hypothetical protein
MSGSRRQKAKKAKKAKPAATSDIADRIVRGRPRDIEGEDELVELDINSEGCNDDQFRRLTNLALLHGGVHHNLTWQFWRRFVQQTYNDYLGAAGPTKIQRRKSQYACSIIREFELSDQDAEERWTEEEWEENYPRWWLALGQKFWEILRTRQRERETIRSYGKAAKSAEKGKLYRRAHPYGGSHQRDASPDEDPRLFSPPGTSALAPAAAAARR